MVTMEYKNSFLNYLKGDCFAEAKMSPGLSNETGSYQLPSTTDNEYEKTIIKTSVMRRISSVFTCYDRPENIWAADSDDIAQFVPAFGSIDIKDIINDFTRISVQSNKLTTLLRLPREFMTDAGFDIEQYFIRRLSKSFARAEDKGFITGTGTNEPIGILNDNGGADVALSADEVTFDDIYSLYYSVAPEFRTNAVWLMNDSTALALRKLKDDSGYYLWNQTDNTILGKPVLVSEYMPDMESGAKPIAFGDFSYYWIVKRSPVTVKLLKELFALNDQNGYFAFEFIDGKLIRSDAVKVIKINEEDSESD